MSGRSAAKSPVMDRYAGLDTNTGIECQPPARAEEIRPAGSEGVRVRVGRHGGVALIRAAALSLLRCRACRYRRQQAILQPAVMQGIATPAFGATGAIPLACAHCHRTMPGMAPAAITSQTSA